MCSVTADTSKLAWSSQRQRAVNGDAYYEIHYDIILLFGLTELKAQISWMDKVRLVVTSHKLDHLHSV